MEMRRGVVAVVAVVALVAVVAVVAATFAQRRRHHPEEGFDGEEVAARVEGVQSGGEAGCPTSAVRMADGSVVLQPQGRRLRGGVREYAEHLTTLVGQGVGCATLPEVVPEGASEEGAPPPEFAHPYATTPILKEADYEYSRVVGSKPRRSGPDAPMAAGEVDTGEALSARAWESSGQGEDEESRNHSLGTVVTALSGGGAGRGSTAAVSDEEPLRANVQGFYRALEGRSLAPPDPVARDAAEAALLAMYRPKGVAEDEAVTPPSLQDLANSAYAEDDQWKPVLTQVGPNRWEVQELVPSGKAVAAAAAAADPTRPLTLAQASRAGLMTTATATVTAEVPGGVAGRRVASGDPYFDKAGVADTRADAFYRWSDFAAWTPGLERAFAPTADTTAWT